MMKKQHYMTYEERLKLEALHREKIPVARIAKHLGFSRQTIYNELKLGMYEHECEWYGEMRYSADKADQIHRRNQTAKGRPLKIGNDHAYANRLEDLMLGRQPNGKTDRRCRYSPAAALAQARKEGYQTSVCVTTLYSYIQKEVFLEVTGKDLWKGTKKKAKETEKRVAHSKLPSITERPDYINTREEPGHVEMDLIVSCSEGSGALLTITERAGRFEIIRKVPDRKAATIRQELKKIIQKYPIHSITTDNGSEFLEYEKLIDTVKCPVYYCHSYAAWEKGSNENHNRMIRRWFPKGTDFSKVPKKEITACEEWMNNYPRRSLGWLTPWEFYKQWTA